jgi:hypothetical protein
VARTTPRKPINVAAFFPELEPYRRTAIRLHPRPGNPGPGDSSVGGPLLWLADEPWPTCAAGPHGVYSLDDGRMLTTDEDVPLVGVVQIHRRDVPQFAFPEGTDLLQVLWCPFLIDQCPDQTPRVYWRDAASIGSVLESVPRQVGLAPEDRIPNPCVVHPESVVEYPSSDIARDLARALSSRMQTLETQTGWKYHYHLADAPGIKLGGYPSWKQEPYWPSCQNCGTTMEHLLTVDSWEYNGESWRTWLPVEDGGGINGQDVQVGIPGEAHAVHEPAGIMIGDAGGIYIFQCQTCPDRPVGYWGDCS